jgi:hypothetical protein
VPLQWKLSRVTPIPKCFPPANIESDLRPIAVTSSLSKVAESFVCQFFNDHFKESLDSNQFGCTSGRSTTFALIKLTHYLFTSFNNVDMFGRILFVDFKKGFDLINHNVLFRKMSDINLPPHLTSWFLSFLNERSQFVCLNSSRSSVKQTYAGTPQGTLSGPANFKLLINDLSFDNEYIKYVDDATAASVSPDPLDGSLQSDADQLYTWSQNNGMIINVTKTREMTIYFGKKYPFSTVDQLVIGGERIDRVRTYKLLGVILNDKLTWEDHVLYIIGKANKRIYCISQLVHAGVNLHEIILVYSSIIRSILEYCCQVWHPGLTGRQSDDIERVQKRCLKIVLPDLSYSSALSLCRLERLDARRERLTRELFQEIKKPNHILYNFMPARNNSTTADLRSSYQYIRPRCRNNRQSKSFINYCLLKKY